MTELPPLAPPAELSPPEASLEPPPAKASLEWDSVLADERAEQAVKWLATHFPECGGSPDLDQHRDAVNEAAVAEDMKHFEEALRALMRAGRRVALERRSNHRRRQYRETTP